MILFYAHWGIRVNYLRIYPLMRLRTVAPKMSSYPLHPRQYWVIRYAPAIAAKAHSQKRNTNRSWRMDETYIKLKGKWVYLYRAVDSQGDTLDFMLSERRDEDAATAFFKQAINNNGLSTVNRSFSV
jgi:hypothetical protein